ncbi:MAG: hypothetical protein Q4D96_03010 [Propionibacteriaceae bacterium]|nr:hypothetical protein [Propionibacteriaceae bacterium]
MALLLPLAFGILLGVLQWALLLWAEAGLRGMASDLAWRTASHQASGRESVQVDGVSNLEVDVQRDSHIVRVTVSGEAVRLLPFVETRIVQSARVPTERLS